MSAKKGICFAHWRIRWVLVWLAALLLGPLVLPVALITPLNYIGLHALVCLGLVLLTGMAGLTSFGQAAFVGLGAYTTAVMVTYAKMSPWLSLPVCLLVTGASATALGWLTIRLSGHYLVLGTMAWGISLYSLFGNLEGLGGHNGLGNLPTLHLPGLDNQPGFYVLIWLAVGIALLGLSNLLDSRMGRAIRSLKDPLMAQSFGVATTGLNVSIFVLAALLAGLSGWLHAHYVSVVNPGPFGIGASIDYLFMTIVGGMTSLAGALVGPAVVEGLRTVVRDLMPGWAAVGGSFEIMVFGAIVILLLRGSNHGLVYGITHLRPRHLSSSRYNHNHSRRTAHAPVAAHQTRSYNRRAQPARGRPISRRAQPARGRPISRRAQPARGSPILQVQGLCKRFGGLVAVEGLDFDLRAGELLGLIGPNGAGKSSLFNLLSGVLQPTAGHIHFMGQSITGLNPGQIAQRGVSRSFQHVRLRPDMSVLENVALGVHGRGGPGLLQAMLRLDRRQERRILFEAQQQLQRVGLEAVADQPAGALALGQQRLVEIARALAADPVLLLLDEPAAGLRLQEKQALAALLAQLRAEGITLLLVEHDMDFVMALADRLVVLHHGLCIAIGPPAQVQRDPQVIEAYLGASGAGG